jgi:phytoene dehydrogenase-like protein
VKNGRAVGVETNQGEFSGQVVVSNAGLRATVLRLTDSENWQANYHSQVAKLEKTLKVVNIFLIFSRSFELPSRFAVFFVCDDVNKEFQTLEKGCFPSRSMYILHVPSNLEVNPRGDHRATLQFYYPRGQVSSRSLDDQVHKVMNDGLERLFKGLSKAITGYALYDPIRYEREFGFLPYVFGVSPDLSHQRFPIQTPITNLYCVGDSVAPEGPCVPQAMESGLDCARVIAAKFGVPLPSD